MSPNETCQADEYFKKFQDDIGNVWAKKLALEFYIQNRLVYNHTNTELELPTFELSLKKGRWGQWSSSTRTMQLSYYLLNNFEWDAVVQTIKHEMAHMIVDEIWRDIPDNNRYHGELFKKACKVMDVEPQRTNSSEDKKNYRIPEREKVLSKIHKLFNLGESNHKSEADAAMAKAHELMIKYNISLKELPISQRAFIFRPVGPVFSNVPEHVKDLARVVSRNYFVKHIYMIYKSDSRRSRTRTQRYIEFYGEAHNVEIAEYIFHFLLVEAERQWADFQQTEEYLNRYTNEDGNLSYVEKYDYINNKCNRRRKGRYSKVAFLQGFTYGLCVLLGKGTEAVKKKIDPENVLPIWSGDKLLDEKFKNHYNPTSWKSGGSGSSGGGRSEGYARGKVVQIRQGVATGPSRGRMLIA